jgi:hypothetical protein
MATDFNIISYTGNTEPKRNDYSTERAYAQAYQEWGNRRNAEQSRANFAAAMSDDNNNSGTQNSASQTSGGENSSNVNKTGQKGNSQTAAWPFPGKRPKNILGDYSSYTYSLSLYMVTPEYLNDFTGARGTLPPGNGIFVVAQSGGVNNTFDQRLITKSGKLGPGQQGLDFYIEDLDLTTILPGGSNKATTTSDIRFKIIEPNGFTFLTDLSRASTALVSQSALLKASGSKPKPPDQKFILGIRFFGYDVDGNLVKSQSKLQSKSNSSYSDAYSIAERFIAIRFSSIKFKLDGKATVYNVEAYQESEQTTYGQVNGTIKSSAPLVASGGTVREAIEGTSGGNSGNRGLLQFLNEYEQDLVTKGDKKIATVYKVSWVGKNNPIPDSKLVDDASVETRLTQLSPSQTTNKVNVSESFKAAVYNPSSRQVTFAAGTTITQALDNLIVKSTYVTESLNQVNNGKPETTTSPNASGKPLQWYAINPVSRVLGRDEKTNDWAYEITYEISVYELPYIRTQYKTSSPKYPGPFKYYSFMLTGENTEVLEYEQTYNNLYYVIETTSTSNDPTSEQSKKDVGVPVHTQGASNSDPSGGKLYKGSEINDNVRAQMYSPGDNAEAKIKVLGDPDYIMSQIGISQDAAVTSSAKSVYGPDFSINPTSGQTFIQIVFNVASDYDEKGLMDVSDKVQFYENNDVERSGIKGIVYEVNQVQSTFSRGGFTQLLECVIVPASQLVQEDTKNTDTLPAASGGSGGSGTSDTSGTSSTPINNKPDVRSPKYSSDEEADRAYEQSNYTLEENYYGGLADTPTPTNASQAARQISYAQESANDDQRTVNDRNISAIYDVKDNPSLTPEQNATVKTQATVASQRASRALESMAGSTRTASGQRRFTRSAN